MANSNAAFGFGQMEHIEERIEKKMCIYNTYKQRFAGYEDQISLCRNGWNGRIGNGWLSYITINPELKKKPEYLLDKLKECNIESRRVWKPLHRQPLYENCRMYSKIFKDCYIYMSDYCFLTGLCLPSDTRMSLVDVNFVADRVIEILEA